MKKIPVNVQGFYVLLILTIFMHPVLAERYRIEDKTAELLKFRDTLAVQAVKLADLLDRVGKLEAWRGRLDEQQSALKLEDERMQEDRKRVDLNEISPDDLQKKWNLSGRWLSYERKRDEFKQDVVRYNQYLKAYNILAQELMPLIQMRSPEEVATLLDTMRQLTASLENAMQRKDVQAAEQLVAESGLAKEFGYSR